MQATDMVLEHEGAPELASPAAAPPARMVTFCSARHQHATNTAYPLCLSCEADPNPQLNAKSSIEQVPNLAHMLAGASCRHSERGLPA